MNKAHNLDEMDMYLYSAMAYVSDKELEEYNAAEPTVFLSEKETKKILKRITRERRYHEKHKTYRPVLEGCRRIAVAVLVILSVCFAGTMSIDAVRSALWQAATEWYERSISFGYVNTEEVPVPEEILSYKEPAVGDEYERYEILRNKDKYLIEYEFEGSLITYQQSLLSEYSVLLSNHDTEMEEITVNGHTGAATQYTSHGSVITTLIWRDSSYAYNLSSDLSLDELLEIAETIQ